MIVPDVNMLVYPHNGAAREHHDARRWWETLLNGTEAVGLPWVVSAGFVRVISNPKMLCPPLGRESAVDYVAELLTTSILRILTSAGFLGFAGTTLWPDRNAAGPG